MSTRTIGLYLGARPSAGGTFQYNQSVVDGLAPLAAEGWRLVAFSNHERWREALPPGYEFRLVGNTRWWRMAYLAWRLVDPAPGGVRRAGRFVPAVSAMNALPCDLILFPSQDVAAYQTTARSLVAIHDLMHRYESGFEEYRGAYFRGRERHYKQICRWAAGILVDSELGARHVAESYGVEARRLHVLPFAPPPYLSSGKPGDVRGKFALPARYFLYPAQFWEHKNHLRLVGALAILRRRCPDAALVLTGERKNQFHRVAQHVQALGLESSVHFLGHVDSADMRGLYLNATGTVFVSLAGPTNIPPLEAMATGCPLILSSAYAMPEQAGDAALLVNPRDPQDIANKMERVWTDPDLRRVLSERGLERTRLWGVPQFEERLRSIVVAVASQAGRVGR